MVAVAQGSEGGEVRRGAGRRKRPRTIYQSAHVAAQADDIAHVEIHLHLSLMNDEVLPQADGSKGVRLTAAQTTAWAAARLEASKRIESSLSSEMDEIIGAYRTLLRESLATGDDAELRNALNRARLQERVLAGTSMADQAQACELLGLSGTNPSATMKRKEDKQEVLRFTIDGRAVYPLFQFDVEGRRIHPGMARLIAMKPAAWSNFRLLHWMTRPHMDFDGTPAAALADEDEVLAAFAREIEPAVHG